LAALGGVGVGVRYSYWGFELEEIAENGDAARRYHVYHTQEDASVNIYHALWYSQKIRGSELVTVAGHGHVSAVVAGEEALLLRARRLASYLEPGTERKE